MINHTNFFCLDYVVEAKDDRAQTSLQQFFLTTVSYHMIVQRLVDYYLVGPKHAFFLTLLLSNLHACIPFMKTHHMYIKILSKGVNENDDQVLEFNQTLLITLFCSFLPISKLLDLYFCLPREEVKFLSMYEHRLLNSRNLNYVS